MTNGKYKVTFEVEIVGMQNGQEATHAIVDMFNEMRDNEEAPAMEFELIEEGVEQEYLEEEEEVEELDLEQAS
jgi:translation elongation factor EF-Tu-like GTPase